MQRKPDTAALDKGVLCHGRCRGQHCLRLNDRASLIHGRVYLISQGFALQPHLPTVCCTYCTPTAGSLQEDGCVRPQTCPGRGARGSYGRVSYVLDRSWIVVASSRGRIGGQENRSPGRPNTGYLPQATCLLCPRRGWFESTRISKYRAR